MLTKYVFIMMLMLAGWIPFQCVFACSMINAPEASTSVDAMSDNSKTATGSQSTTTVCDNDMAADAHHSMQECIYCVSFYGGAFRLPEFLPRMSQWHLRYLSLYDDHIPVVPSLPPLNFIA